ncbi:MAG: hypothetical protein HYU64_01470 [Armatimonadetes bacterium]|nr:hypothetical protein [Armatimonadota bacterium]
MLSLYRWRITLLFSLALLFCSFLLAEEEDYFAGWDKDAVRAKKAFNQDHRVFGSVNLRVGEKTEIWIDSDPYGSGPKEGIVLPEGEHRIRIMEKSGSREKTVPVRKGVTTVALESGEIRLTYSSEELIYCKIRILSNVDARIFREQSLIGDAPLLRTYFQGPQGFQARYGDTRSIYVYTTLKPHMENTLHFEYNKMSRLFSPRLEQRYVPFSGAPTDLTESGPAVSSKARFSIETYPAGTLYVDEEKIGRTPLFDRILSPGSRRIRVISDDNRRSYEDARNLSQGESLRLDVNLIEKGKGCLDLDSIPKGKLFIDGQCYGYTLKRGIQLTPGEHRFRITDPLSNLYYEDKVDISENSAKSVLQFLYHK